MAATKLTRIEVFVQLTIVVLTVWAMLHSQSAKPEYIPFVQGFGATFREYLELARGNIPVYVYKQWVGYLFVPFLWLSSRYGDMQAVYLWTGLLAASYMILTHFVMKVKYGTVLSLVCLYFFWYSQNTGNITPILCVALLSPWTAWLVVLVKPHFVVLAIGVAIAHRFQHLPVASSEVGLYNFAHADFLSHSEMEKRKEGIGQ